jgi:hypothetical protein
MRCQERIEGLKWICEGLDDPPATPLVDRQIHRADWSPDLRHGARRDESPAPEPADLQRGVKTDDPSTGPRDAIPLVTALSGKLVDRIDPGLHLEGLFWRDPAEARFAHCSVLNADWYEP